MCSRGRHPPRGGAPRPLCPADFETRRKIEMQPQDALPHDVIHYSTTDYPWRIDAYHCYLLAIRLKSIAIGATRPATPNELYWAERHSQIP
jgi:hypothetical protein